MSHLIFLSHIHEEAILAQIIQNAIEEEFSGFVEVFQFSDDMTNPAGTNFLYRIEDKLVNCEAAIYLISPFSVVRNWMNFELGAVWIRNIISVRNIGREIPVIPLCHSGTVVSKLPMPLNNLKSLQANIAAHLEGVFKSIQIAVGVAGKGKLKTDFAALSERVKQFERKYTLGDNIIKLLKLINKKIDQFEINLLINHFKNVGRGERVIIGTDYTSPGTTTEIRHMEENELKDYIRINKSVSRLSLSEDRLTEAYVTELEILSDVIIDFENRIRLAFL